MFSSYGPVPNQTVVSIGEFGFGLRALNGPEHGRSDIPREPDARNAKFSRSRYVPVGCNFGPGRISSRWLIRGRDLTRGV